MSLPRMLSQKLRLPLLGFPLFKVSGPELVIAQSKSGIVGSFPALNTRSQPVQREWLTRIGEELSKHDPTNPTVGARRSQRGSALLRRHRLHDVTNGNYARRAIAKRADFACAGTVFIPTDEAAPNSGTRR